MSRFSGKCDLCDSINMNSNDELANFNKFKKETNGEIYQLKKFTLTESNIDQEILKINDKNILFKIKNIEICPDKKYKSGQRTKIYFTYIYNGHSYRTLKEVNKVGYFVKKTIKFETLLDIIPYYSYIIGLSCSSDGHKIIYISDESYVDTEEKEAYEHGYISKLSDYYRKELQKHYNETLLKYYGEKINERY